MARDERKRQKKLAAQKAKRKKLFAGRRRAKAPTPGMVQVIRASSAPVHECLVSEGIFEIGIGNLIVSRKLENGQLGVSTFLLDVYCLGVKDAFFTTMSEPEYEATLNHLKQQGSFNRMSPECARKLVEDAEAYASGLGLRPHPDYRLAGKIFGDIDKIACQMGFEFGKDGMPYYVAGPRDTPEKSMRIINILAERCGADGFHYLSMIGGPFGDYVKEFDE
jgi:hypothetical protein